MALACLDATGAGGAPHTQGAWLAAEQGEASISQCMSLYMQSYHHLCGL